MSGTSNWLRAQKKAELAELAQELGIEDYEGLKKTELETALDDYLNKHSGSHSADSRFRQFYSKKRLEGSPVKKDVASALEVVEQKGRAVKRRITKAAEEVARSLDTATSDDEESSALAARARALTRTPRAAAMSLAASVPLPPSPAVVADAIDRKTAVIRSRLSTAIESYGVKDHAEAARETLSTVTAIQALTVLFEFYHLRKAILPDRHAFNIPHTFIPGRSSDYPVAIPDLFLLLTSQFWGPTLLWLVTSLLMPLTAAYFFNLTSTPQKRHNRTSHFNYRFDPLTFNIVKALIVYVVFGQDVTFGGLVDLEYVAWINEALYAGWESVIVGNLVGTVVTLYEAVLKK